MDEKTIQFYAENARAMAQRYDSVEGGISDFFAEVFGKAPIKILDVGCGSGRDLKRLQDLGHEVWGVDACKEFLQLAHENHQIEENHLVEASLPDLDIDFTTKFEGVLCSAVLMHLPPDDLPKALDRMLNLLNPMGTLLLSYSTARPGLDEEDRDDRGRYFAPIPESIIPLLMQSKGAMLRMKRKVQDASGREGVEWVVQVFQKLF